MRMAGEASGVSGATANGKAGAAAASAAGAAAASAGAYFAEAPGGGGDAHLVEEILAEVEFLQPMVEIASGHHSNFDGTGYGGSGHRHGERPSPESSILAVADAFDAMTSTRSYRMALTQAFALDELRRNAGAQFDPLVIDALEQALRRVGETYGSSNLDNEELARRLAEQVAIRESV